MAFPACPAQTSTVTASRQTVSTVAARNIAHCFLFPIVPPPYALPSISCRRRSASHSGSGQA